MRPNIDFVVINSGDPAYLMVSDLSEYYFIEDKPTVIHITPPGSTEPIKAYWTKHAINVFQSVNLGLQCLETCGDQEYLPLSDGFWKIGVFGSPSDTFYKERYYLKTDLLQLDLDKIYANVGLEYDPRNKQFRDWYIDVNIALDAAHAHTKLGDIPKAKMFYEEAISFVKRYSECKNCY